MPQRVHNASADSYRARAATNSGPAKRSERLNVELVAVIHDEVIVQTPTPFADRVRGIVEQAMIDGMQTFVSSVPITAEAVVGRSWAEK